MCTMHLSGCMVPLNNIKTAKFALLTHCAPRFCAFFCLRIVRVKNTKMIPLRFFQIKLDSKMPWFAYIPQIINSLLTILEGWAEGLKEQ